MPGKARNWDPLIPEITKMLDEGATIEEAAERFEASVVTLQRQLRARGLTNYLSDRRNMRWGRVVKQAAEMLDADKTTTLREVARVLNVYAGSLRRQMRRHGLGHYLTRRMPPRNPSWSEKLPEILKALDEDTSLTPQAAARRFGVSGAALQSWMRRNGMRKYINRNRTVWSETLPKVMALMDANPEMSTKAAAEQLGLDPRALWRKLRQKKLTAYMRRENARHDWDTLMPKIVEYLKARRDRTPAMAAKRFGLNDRVVIAQLHKTGHSNLVGRNVVRYDWKKLLPEIIAALDADQRLTVPQAAARFGVGERSLLEKLQRAKITRFLGRVGRRSTFTDEDWAKIDKWITEQRTVVWIAKQLGRVPSTVYSAIRSKGWDKRLARTPHSVDVFDKAVELLTNDRTLSLSKAADAVGVSLWSLTCFLKSVNLHEKFARRFRTFKKPGTRTERNTAQKRVNSAIKLQVGDIYKNVRTGALYIAVAPRCLVTVENGALVKRRPTSVHYLMHDMEVRSLAAAWNVSIREIDKIVEQFIGRPDPTKAIDKLRDRPSRGRNQEPAHVYRVRIMA